MDERTRPMLPMPPPITRLAYSMREPCRFCGEPVRGYLEPSNGQNVVRCAECGRACYNAPKWETGEAPKTLATRPDIKVSTRSRILDRDNHVCVGCHRDNVPLEVGHLLSVKDGRALDATDAELWHDENLAAMCSACNSGFSGRSVSLRLVYRLLQSRIRQTDR